MTERFKDYAATAGRGQQVRIEAVNETATKTPPMRMIEVKSAGARSTDRLADRVQSAQIAITGGLWAIMIVIVLAAWWIGAAIGELAEAVTASGGAG
jgi:uncharacterized membrane protein